MSGERTGIYARKSSDNEAGVARQVEIAKDCISANGWIPPAEPCVYTDNDISGGVFDRPGLNALLEGVMQRPRPFEILVMMDGSRLGRNMEETLPLQLKIIRAGVRIFHYQDNQELLLDTPVQKLVASVANFSHEDFKHQIGLKTASALRKKFRQGHVCGNRLFGYRNVPQNVGLGPNGEHTHVVRERDPEQAATVLRHWTLYADGLGNHAIRNLFNKEGVRGPRYPRPWSDTTLRDMLKQETYRGVVVRNGERIEKPELRIVSDELWERVSARLQRRREIYRRTPLGRLAGRTSEEDRKGLLLSGLLKCGLCGSNMWAEAKIRGSKKYKDQRLIRRWRCSANIARGPSACANDTRVVDQWMQHHIIAAVRGALDPAEVAETMRAALAAQKTAAEDRKVRRARLERELADAEKRVQNLREAIGLGGDLPVLVGDLKAALGRVDKIQTEMRKGGTTPDEVTIEQARYRAQVALDTMQFDSDRDPAAKVAAVRSLLRAYLAEPLRCFPATSDGVLKRGFRFEGELALGRLLAGSTFLPKEGQRVMRYTYTRSLASREGATRSGCRTRRS